MFYLINGRLGMVGYTESLTDPSYEGQILILTYPIIGNYGVPRRPNNFDDLPDDFESSRIHIAALVVGYYSEDFSHFLATSSLGAWLKENGVPAIYGVDTRSLTKKIREKGSMLGKLLAHSPAPSPPNIANRLTVLESAPTSRVPSPAPFSNEHDIPFYDPNQTNLVAAVSIKSPDRKSVV